MRLTILKSLLSIGVLTCCFSGCTTQIPGRIVQHDAKSGYTIITDTITLNANEYISKVHKMKLINVESYRDRYICQFYHHNYTSHLNELNLAEGHLLLSISKDGQDVYQLPIPIEYYDWNNSWATIKVVSDTLYCYNKAKNFYWDEGSRQWMATDKKMSNDYYEDDTYTVHSEDRGEWGEFTRFHEKQTGFDYLFMAPMITAIKFEDAYYIVGPLQLRKVADPHKGWEMNDSIKYGKWASIAPIADIVYGTKYHNWYEYEYSNDHSQDTLFCSGFLRNDQMHLLMRDSANTFIAKYRKGRQASIEKVLSLGNIPVECNIDLNNQDELTLHFHEDWTKEGILNIAKDTVHIRYIKKHQDTLQYMGIQALEQVVGFVANNIGKATINDIQALEEKTGGCHDGHIMESTRNGNPSYEFMKKEMGPALASVIYNYDDEDKVEGYERINYFHAIDESDSFCVGYCFQKETQILTTVMIELYQTRFVTSYNPYIFGRCTRGSEKFASIISKCLSVEPDSKGVWHKGDVTIRTFSRDNCFVIKTEKR